VKLKWIIAVLFFFFVSTQNTTAQWTKSRGLEGAEVNDILVHDSFIFMPTPSGGIYRKHIDGENWSNEIGNDYYISEVESTDSAVFGRGYVAFCRSLDNGVSWQLFDGDFQMARTLSTVGNTVIVSQMNGELFKSDDQGETWDTIAFNFPDFGISKTLVSDSALFVVDFYGDSLLRTNDFGEEWEYLNWLGLPESQPRYISDIVVWGDSIYAATKEGVFVFLNNETGWQARNSGIGEANEVFDFEVINDTLFCAGDVGFLYFEDNIWTAENDGLETLNLTCLSGEGDLKVCGSDFGPSQKNADGQWEQINYNLNHLDIYFIAAHNGIVWASADKGLFRSDDLGNEFELMEFDEFSSCRQMVCTDSLYYLSSNNGLMVSEDFGESWSTVFGEDKHYGDIAIGDDYIFFNTSMGFYRIEHVTYNCDTLPSWMADKNVWEIAAKGNVLISTVYNDDSYVSTDQGLTFTSCLSSPAYEIIVDNNTFYAISPYYSLQKSEDGINWQEFPFPDNEWSGSVLAANQEAIVVGGSLLSYTYYDILAVISYDGGNSWRDISDGLPVPYWPITNAVELFDYKVFVSPANNGLWFREDLLLGSEEYYSGGEQKITLFPNPVINTLIVEVSNEFAGQIFVLNLQGTVLQQAKLNSAHVELNVEDLSTGVYLLQIVSQGKNITKLFVKQ